MTKPAREVCAELFREISGLVDSSIYYSWSNERLLAKPVKELDVDSLALLEFVMAVENRYNIELDDARVQACRTVGELCALVEVACNEFIPTAR